MSEVLGIDTEYRPNADGYDLKFPSERARKRRDEMAETPPLPSGETLMAYITRRGRRVLAVRIGNNLVGVNSSGFPERWELDGRRLASRETEDDIVRAVPKRYPLTVPHEFISTVSSYVYPDLVAQYPGSEDVRLPDGWEIQKNNRAGITIVNPERKAKGLDHRAAIMREVGQTDDDLLAALSRYVADAD